MASNFAEQPVVATCDGSEQRLTDTGRGLGCTIVLAAGFQAVFNGENKKSAQHG
jgi:hypothetical protein